MSTNRNKYNLSEEGIDKLLDRLTDIANSDLEDEGSEFEGAKITTDFMKKVAKVDDLHDVINRNEQLTKHFKGLLSMYGFDSMYDMYMYAMSCDALEDSIKKSKDYSKLVPQKRKITRNGKSQEVTVWVKPDEGESDDSNNDESERGTPNKGRRRTQRRRKTAKELPSKVTTELDKDLGKLDMNLPKGSKPIQVDSNYYIEIEEEGNIVGLIGIKEVEGYLTMDFYRTNGSVPGVASRGFFEILKLANEKNKGVRMDDDPNARGVFTKTGLNQNKEGYWVIEYEELKDTLSFLNGDNKDE